jgi:hypothetical protein
MLFVCLAGLVDDSKLSDGVVDDGAVDALAVSNITRQLGDCAAAVVLVGRQQRLTNVSLDNQAGVCS